MQINGSNGIRAICVRVLQCDHKLSEFLIVLTVLMRIFVGQPEIHQFHHFHADEFLREK